jgi:hypothetical protein
MRSTAGRIGRTVTLVRAKLMTVRLALIGPTLAEMDAQAVDEGRPTSPWGAVLTPEEEAERLSVTYETCRRPAE